MVSINTETELPLSVDTPSVVLEVTYAEPLKEILPQMLQNPQLLKLELWLTFLYL
jgi:hypothetical protein